jgi:glycine cleavage system H protein
MVPEELRYNKEHVWVRTSGKKKVTIGITEHAQDQLGDIVYIDLPEPETDIEVHTEIGEIESTKATSPIVAPLNGKISEVNEELSETPEMINDDPYGKGWIAVIEVEDMSEIDDLMDSSEYSKFVEEEAK